jgi:hypothetical protein
MHWTFKTRRIFWISSTVCWPLLYFLSDSDTFFSSCSATFSPRGSVSSVSACYKAGQTRFRFSARNPRGGPLLSGNKEENKSGTQRVLYVNIVACLIKEKINKRGDKTQSFKKISRIFLQLLGEVFFESVVLVWITSRISPIFIILLFVVGNDAAL